jgi:hypothetical protein
VALRESGLRPEQLAIDFEILLLIWLEKLLVELKLYSICQKIKLFFTGSFSVEPAPPYNWVEFFIVDLVGDNFSLEWG